MNSDSLTGNIQGLTENKNAYAFRGDRLRGIREAKGLKRAALAAITGLDAGGIQRLEDGTTKHPRQDTVETLAEKLDVTTDFFAGAGPDLPYEKAAILQARERFERFEGWKSAPLDRDALARAAEDEDAPDTVAEWRAFVSMSRRAWGTSPRYDRKTSTGDNRSATKRKRSRSNRTGHLVGFPTNRKKDGNSS